MRPAALLFDFNGTLLDDEHIQCEIYQEICCRGNRGHRQACDGRRIVDALDIELMQRLLG